MGVSFALSVLPHSPANAEVVAVTAPVFEAANRGTSPLRVPTSGGTRLYLYGVSNVLDGATATFTPYVGGTPIANVPIARDSVADMYTVTAPAMPAGPVKITLFNPGSSASVFFMTVSYGNTIVNLPVTCSERVVSLNANVGDYVRLIPSGACNDTWVQHEGWRPDGVWSVGAMANLTAPAAAGFGYQLAQHPLSRVGSFTNPSYWAVAQPDLASSENGSWHPVIGSDWNDPNWEGGYNLFQNEPTGIMLQVNAGTEVGDKVAFLYEKATFLNPAVQIPIVYAGPRVEPAPAPIPEPAPAPIPEPAPAPVIEPTRAPTVAPIAIPTTAPVAAPVELPSGSGGALINGVATPVTMATAADGKGVVVSAGGVTVQVAGTAANGAPLPLAPDGSLIIAESGGVQMGGSGFSPNSTVSLFLYSTPTKLGEIPVSASGSYGGVAVIPAGVDAGSHTIQAVGYTPEGKTLALSVGVTVKSAAVVRGSNPSVTTNRGSKGPGERFVVSASGIQSRCEVHFWTKGSTAKTTAGVAGRASATLTAPRSRGTWVITATVSGNGCEKRIAKSTIRIGKTF